MSKQILIIEGLFGFLVLFTVLFQNYYLLKTVSNYSSANYYSYFTILSNLLVAFICLMSAFQLADKNTISLIKAGATLYVLITGLVFVLVLKGQNDLFLSWVNIILHYVVPVFMLVNWLFIPHEQISFQQSLIWIALMVVYVIYTLVRGAITSWYPYDFINPNMQGVSGVTLYMAGITILVLVLDTVILRLPHK